MGDADVILGIKIKKTKDGFSLCQSHYIVKMSKKFNNFDVTLVKTPYHPNIHLKKNKGSSIFQTEHAKIIRSVTFLMNSTRPKIPYAISRVSLYTHNPSNEHQEALFRLLKYLRSTINWCLHFNNFLLCQKDFVTQIGFLTMMKLALLVVMCLHLVDKPSRGSLPSKLVQLTLPWKMNSLILSWQVEKYNG